MPFGPSESTDVDSLKYEQSNFAGIFRGESDSESFTLRFDKKCLFASLHFPVERPPRLPPIGFMPRHPIKIGQADFLKFFNLTELDSLLPEPEKIIALENHVIVKHINK